MLTEPMLLSIAATGFTVAFLHAALPTHWLPFVLAGRGQKWSKGKTLAITALASLGHVSFTTLLGVLVVFLGIETKNWTGHVFPLIVSGVLFLFGLYYLVRQVRGAGGHHHWKLPWTSVSHTHEHIDGHKHSDNDQAHSHPHEGSQAQESGCQEPHTLKSGRTDPAVIIGLLALLTFSPCEGFLPVYLSGVQYGWAGFALLSALLAVATMTGMVFFTWLTMAGLERLQLKTLEKYELGIMGGLLWVLAIIVLLME
ncbi:MAG: hypothetical protein LLF94_12695 [Chlamydiales bacterium]|nr:hypothetical protein [Chlamydiales bacterium]